MKDHPGLTWLAHYRERVNADPELKVIGEWCTTTFALAFGDSRYALKVASGSSSCQSGSRRALPVQARHRLERRGAERNCLYLLALGCSLIPGLGSSSP